MDNDKKYDNNICEICDNFCNNLIYDEDSNQYLCDVCNKIRNQE